VDARVLFVKVEFVVAGSSITTDDFLGPPAG
jgi:hypothetical protein